VIAKIGDRQRWNDELGVDAGERSIFGSKIRQYLELGLIAKHRRLGDNTVDAPRLLHRAFAGLERSHRGLVDDHVLAGVKRRYDPVFVHRIRQREVDDICIALPQRNVVIGKKKRPRFGHPSPGSERLLLAIDISSIAVTFAAAGITRRCTIEEYPRINNRIRNLADGEEMPTGGGHPGSQ
jgi:hypothetical protein